MFEIAFRYGATRLIVAHNHPSGSCLQSEQDEALTRILLQGAQTLDMVLLDHVIVGGNDWRSLRQHTTLWHELPQFE